MMVRVSLVTCGKMVRRQWFTTDLGSERGGRCPLVVEYAGEKIGKMVGMNEKSA